MEGIDDKKENVEQSMKGILVKSNKEKLMGRVKQEEKDTKTEIYENSSKNKSKSLKEEEEAIKQLNQFCEVLIEETSKEIQETNPINLSLQAINKLEEESYSSKVEGGSSDTIKEGGTLDRTSSTSFEPVGRSNWSHPG